MTNILTIIALYTDNKNIIRITLYWALIGPLLSLLFVEMDYIFPHFRFFHYYLVHAGFMLGNLYFLASGKLEISRRGVNLSCLVLLAVSGIVLVIDIIVKHNYLFLICCPITEISDALHMPWYTILWMAVIFLLINGLYYLLKFIRFLSRRVIG